MKSTPFVCVALSLAANIWAADAPPELKITHPKRGEITRFVMLPGQGATWDPDDQDLVIAEIAEFLTGVRPHRPATRTLGPLASLPEGGASSARTEAIA